MSQRIWGAVTGFYLVLCLLLGGASAAGFLANAALQGLGVLLILALAWANRASLPREARPLAWLVGLFILFVMASLVPLPPGLWEGLSYRGEIAGELRQLGLEPGFMPASLMPRATIASILSIIPPATVFLLVLTLGPEARRWLGAAVMAVAIISVGLGIFQLLGGSNSPLRFYEITNPDSPVGFFANVNHNVTLMLCAIPLAGAVAARMAARSDRSRRTGGLVLSAATILFLLVGIGLAGSIAGYGLMLASVFAALLIYRRAVAGRLSLAWRAGLGVMLILFLGVALVGPLNQETLSGKFSDNPTSRGTIAATTIDAATKALPLGTGLGSFSQVYRRFQDPKRASNEFVNHAHNDYLEVLLELGVVGILFVLFFILWWGRRSLKVWGEDFSGAALSRAGTAIVGLVLLHSLVDYPIRTAAIAALFAFATGLMLPARSDLRALPAPEERKNRVRHVSAG